MTEPSDHQPDIDPQGIWQSQEKEYDAMTLADIHQKARKFELKIQRRNALEYAACGVVMVGFLPAVLFGPNWMMRAGGALIMLGTAYVGWQLHRRGSVDASPEPGETLVDGYRRQLVRQREALRTVATWYLAPLLPGMACFIAGLWIQGPRKPGVTLEKAHTSLLVMAVVWVVLCVGIWMLNQRAAKRLQKRIDEL